MIQLYFYTLAMNNWKKFLKYMSFTVAFKKKKEQERNT